MLKRMVLYLLSCTLIIAMLAAGCSGRSTSSEAGASSTSESEPNSAIEEIIAEESPVSSGAVSQPEDNTGADNMATAAFALSYDGDAQKMAVGDTIGDWSLADLQITYSDDNSINMLEALFAGEVTLKGTISTSLLLEGAFDFRVAPEDEGKMPCYITPEMAPKDEIWMMLNIPDGLADTLDIESEAQCVITVSDYRFIFAYMTAPASATVVDIELVG